MEGARPIIVIKKKAAHGGQHGDEACDGPGELPEREGVGRAETLFGHHCGGAEHHHQAEKNQQQGDGEQPAIDTDALRHGGILISPRRHGGMETFCCGF